MMATPFMTRSCLNLAKRSSRLRVFSSNSNSSVSNILCQLQEGKINVKQAETLLSGANNKDPEETLQSFANLDHGRAMRAGFPEAVFAQGKTSKQVALILDDMAMAVNKAIEKGQSDSDSASTAILATRVTSEQFEELQKYPLMNGTLTYHETARIVSMKASGFDNIATPDGAPTTERIRVVVACAGTTDLPVAEEAAVTLEAAGCTVDRIYDVGVAGLHRIVKAIPRLRDPSVGCVIVCAGMDGALPSVVGGLVSVPVIAAPTSIGYGASFGGVSAMLTMLNSCAPGVGVVNIDNGFGAAALAYKCIKK